MRRFALNRCLRAALSETFIAAVFLCLSHALFGIDAHAQFLPSGCPGQWVQGSGGMMCLCPGGTYANMVGNQIVCPPRAQAQSQVGAYCSNGGTCGVGYRCSWMPGKCVPEGKVDCGTYNCEPGFKCSSARCIAQDAVDCGGGHYCNAGYFCGRNGRCMPEGSIECGDHACRLGFKCGSGDKCLTSDAVDCGDGHYCPAGSRCEGSLCVVAEIRAPGKTNPDRVVETLREIGAWIMGGAAKPFPSVPVDVLLFLSGVVLGVALILLRFVARRRSQVEQVSIHEEPALLKAGRAPPEEPRVPSAVEQRDVACSHEPPSEHRDVAGAGPSSVHDDSPWAVHSNLAAEPTSKAIAYDSAQPKLWLSRHRRSGFRITIFDDRTRGDN